MKGFRSPAAVLAASALLAMCALVATAYSQFHTAYPADAAAAIRSPWAGSVLIAGGWGHSPTVELYDPPSRKFHIAGKMDLFFAGVAAIELRGPEVLLLGGRRQDYYDIPGGQVYDARTGRFVAVGKGVVFGTYFATVGLANGKVLITGGLKIPETGPPTVADAFIYDPAAHEFSATGAMAERRCGASATLLNDGRVLVAGGTGETPVSLASAEIYDPRTGKFTAAGKMRYGREQHSATLLRDGTVLIAGGFEAQADGAKSLADAELFDPGSGHFKTAGKMSSVRGAHAATLLDNGDVLITGGENAFRGDQVMASAELYDAATHTFTSAGTMLQERYSHTATLLDDGDVLIAGGATLHDWLASAELYHPRSGKFEATGAMAHARYGQSAVVLSGKWPAVTIRAPSKPDRQAGAIVKPPRSRPSGLRDSPRTP
jgi:Kelch motif/Galactose oxidase, central domain